MQKIVRTPAPPGIDFSKDWADFSSEEKNQIRDALMKMTGGRCAYTGKKIDDNLAVIDHFIPLKISQSSGWNNLYVVNPVTEHLKSDKYDEKLIRPDEAAYEFDKYFDIDFDRGFIIPNPKANPQSKKRAKITIDILGLNHQSIVAERRAEASQFLIPSDLGNNYFPQSGGLTLNLNLDIFSYPFYLEKAREKFKEPKNEYVNEVDISKCFCIENFKIEHLKDKKEIYFLGENGDGKTIILQALVMALKGLTDKFVYKYINPLTNNFSIKINDELNNRYEYNDFESYVHANVYAYGIEGRLRKHKNHEDEGYLSLFNSDIYLIDPVEWFKSVDRLEHKGIGGLKFATVKKLFEELLEGKVQIVETQEGDYIFKEKNTIFQFHQLSHGYRSVLIWLSDLLSRLSKSQYRVEHLKDYKAVVLVDEIGSFLHPRWEYSIVGKLRKLFPKIQWFFTTHSPIITLGASEDAVFYKLYKEEGITKVSEPFHAEVYANRLLSNFATSPLFNLDTARPAAFDEDKHEDLETGNYLYRQIHKQVKERMKNKPLQEDEIRNAIDEILDELEKEGQI